MARKKRRQKKQRGSWPRGGGGTGPSREGAGRDSNLRTSRRAGRPQETEAEEGERGRAGSTIVRAADEAEGWTFDKDADLVIDLAGSFELAKTEEFMPDTDMSYAEVVRGLTFSLPQAGEQEKRGLAKLLRL